MVSLHLFRIHSRGSHEVLPKVPFGKAFIDNRALTYIADGLVQDGDIITKFANLCKIAERWDYCKRTQYPTFVIPVEN